MRRQLMPLERRKNDRFSQSPSAMPTATISMVKPFFQEPFEVEIHDVSSGGLKVYSPESIPLHYEFDIEVYLPKEPVRRCKGRAVYKIPSDLGFNVGIHYIDPEKPKDANYPSRIKDEGSQPFEPWNWLRVGK